MSDKTIIFFLAVVVCLLFLVVLYQRFIFGRGIQAKIKRMNKKLEEILETGSDEKVMVFTDNPVLMELGGQINRLLIDRQKIRADFKREEISSKKMLANISHDIKTPLTVILGYLEIMRLNHADNEMLKKVETKANQVMNLINQFFTLAKLESGDTNINLGKVNINEICRENVLEFYDILLQKDFFLGTLSTDSRKIFMRRYWYMNTIKEIAKGYSMSESKVKMSLLRSRKELKQLLEKEGFDL